MPERERGGIATTDQGKINVLVVEDDLVQCNDIAAALEGLSVYHCHKAYDLGKAVTEVTERDFDLMSADLRLGEADTGYILVPPARARNPWMGIVFYTMFPERELLARAAGASAFLVKSADIPSASFVSLAQRVTEASLRRKLIDLSATVAGACSLVGLLNGGEPADLPSRNMASAIGKLHLLDPDTTYPAALRLDRLAGLIRKPLYSFLLSFIRDRGPLPLDALQEHLALAAVQGQIRPIDYLVVAGLLKRDDNKITLSEEGDKWLQVFGF